MTLNTSRIRAERVAKNMTQAEMAHKLGMGRGSYAKREAGFTNIGANELAKIAEVLDVNISVFFSETSPNENEK